MYKDTLFFRDRFLERRSQAAVALVNRKRLPHPKPKTPNPNPRTRATRFFFTETFPDPIRIASGRRNRVRRFHLRRRSIKTTTTMTSSTTVSTTVRRLTSGPTTTGRRSPHSSSMELSRYFWDSVEMM